MTIEELIDAVEKERELLSDIISDKDTDLQDGEVLAQSQQLDKLILAYLRIRTAKTNLKKGFHQALLR